MLAAQLTPSTTSRFDKAFSLIPGAKRLNLHAIYLESDTPVDRDKIEPKHFENWVEWAKTRAKSV